MNDATSIAQKDSPAANAGSTQFLKDAVSEEEEKNRTTIDGKPQKAKSSMRNLASEHAQVVSTQRAGSTTDHSPPKPRHRALTLLAISAAFLAALIGFVLLSSYYE